MTFPDPYGSGQEAIQPPPGQGYNPPPPNQGFNPPPPPGQGYDTPPPGQGYGQAPPPPGQGYGQAPPPPGFTAAPPVPAGYGYGQYPAAAVPQRLGGDYRVTEGTGEPGDGRDGSGVRHQPTVANPVARLSAKAQLARTLFGS